MALPQFDSFKQLSFHMNVIILMIIFLNSLYFSFHLLDVQS